MRILNNPLFDSVVSLWYKLFGSKLPKSLVDGDKLMRVWRDIYSGQPEWQKYTTRGLYGNRTNYRFLLNAAKLVCSELSGLVFAEMPKITTDPDIMDVLEKNRFKENMQAWLEKSCALGNGALKWTFKGGEPILDFVSATDYIPVTYDSRGVTEADFLGALVKDKKEFKVVESHRVIEGGYSITIKAYQKQVDGSYKEVPPETAGLAETYSEVMTEYPLFQGWKVPEANNIDLASPLGISIFANAIDTARQLDEAFDNLAKERTDTQRKVIIGSSMISSVFDTAKKKQDVYYDKNQDVWVAFNDDEKEKMMPKEIAFDFRVDAIVTDINLLLGILCKQCGLSDNFLSFNGTSMKTATEIVSENSKTFRTKKNIENSLESVIIGMMNALRAVGGDDIKTTDMDYSIQWDDSVIEDRAQKETRIINLYNARLISLEDALMQLTGIDEAKAMEKAAAIRAQTATIDIGGWGAE